MRSGMLGLAAIAAALAAAPAYAQNDAALDALIDGSATPTEALALAHKQVAEGDALGAAATLERALMTHSKNDTGVRLYYATVLCSVDDRQTALTEIGRAGHVEPDSAAWAETKAACGDVELPARMSTLTGEISFGVAYDSDLSRSLLIEYALPGYPLVTPDDGFSATASARLGYRSPDSGGVFFYAAGGAATRNPLSGSSPDFQTGDVALGAGTRSGSADFSLGAVARHARVGGHPFVTEYGGEAEVGIAVPHGVGGRLALRGEVVKQDFMGSTALFSRDGTRIDIALTYSGGDAASRFWAGGAYEHKQSETARTGYAGGRIGAGFRHGFTGGAYTTLASTLRYVEYEDEVGYSQVSETRFFGRAALGVPLGVSGLNLEAAANYSARTYNETSTLRDYTNVGGELRLVWTFGH